MNGGNQKAFYGFEMYSKLNVLNFVWYAILKLLLISICFLYHDIIPNCGLSLILNKQSISIKIWCMYKCNSWMNDTKLNEPYYLCLSSLAIKHIV